MTKDMITALCGFAACAPFLGMLTVAAIVRRDRPAALLVGPFAAGAFAAGVIVLSTMAHG